MTGKDQMKLLVNLKKQLTETEAERKFMQSQTGHHVSRDLRDQYDSEVRSLRKRIEELENY